MTAFKAAKRALLFSMIASLLFVVPLAQAGDSGYLGVMLQDVSPSMAKALQLGDEAGVLINQVVEDSPAAEAGLEDGDVIVAFEGKSLDDYSDLTKAVGAHKPGAKVSVTVLRDGKKQDIDVELGERDDDVAWSWKSGDHDMAEFHEMLKDSDGDFVFPEGEHGNVFVKRFSPGDDEDMDVFFVGEDRGYMGVHLDDLNEQLGEYFGVDEGQGARVTEVVEDSPAAEAGLKAGDVIVKIDDDEIDGAGGLHEFMSDTEKDQKVTVHYKRKGRSGKADVTLGEAPATEFSDHIKIMADRDHNMHFDGPRKMRVKRAPFPQRHVEVIREFDDQRESMDELRGELDKLRAELDAMKKELDK